MVGAKKKKKGDTSLPQFKVGEIYHSDLYCDRNRRGHFVIVAEILSPTQIKVYVCTSSPVSASWGSIDAYGLLGPGETYILTKPEIISPLQIGASRHMSVPKEIADRLGINL